MLNTTTYKQPYVPVFPKECLPAPDAVKGRGLPYLRSVLEIVGRGVALREGEVYIQRTVRGEQIRRAVSAIKVEILGFKVRFADSRDEEMVFTATPQEEEALIRAVLRQCAPDPEKVEYQYLHTINASFIMEHGDLDESDFEKIFNAQKLMATLRLGAQAHNTPFPGDTLQGAYYNGSHPFTHGIILSRPRWAAEGDTRIHFCAQPYVPYLCSDGALDTSGGPFFAAQKKHFSFLGEEERLFWCFGHDGACSNGGIHFPCRSNRWQLSEDAGI